MKELPKKYLSKIVGFFNDGEIKTESDIDNIVETLGDYKFVNKSTLIPKLLELSPEIVNTLDFENPRNVEYAKDLIEKHPTYLLYFDKDHFNKDVYLMALKVYPDIINYIKDDPFGNPIMPQVKFHRECVLLDIVNNLKRDLELVLVSFDSKLSNGYNIATMNYSLMELLSCKGYSYYYTFTNIIITEIPDYLSFTIGKKNQISIISRFLLSFEDLIILTDTDVLGIDGCSLTANDIQNCGLSLISYGDGEWAFVVMNGIGIEFVNKLSK